MCLIPLPGPHCSVSSVQDLRTVGRWFDPHLGQYFLQELMKVIATGLIPLSPLSIVSTVVMWESSEWLGRNIVQRTECLKELQESMNMCTGCRDITEILLKTVFNTIQSIIRHIMQKKIFCRKSCPRSVYQCAILFWSSLCSTSSSK